MSLKVWSLILAINITEMGFADRLAQRDNYNIDLSQTLNTMRGEGTKPYVAEMIPTTDKSMSGYLGPVKSKTGRTMTEFSMDLDVKQPDGSVKEMRIPSLVPGLNQSDVDLLATDEELMEAPEEERIKFREDNKDQFNKIFKTASTHAERRLAEGKSAYYQDDEPTSPLVNYKGKDVEIDNQVRNKLYPGEDKYFKENPNVGGMMTEDNKVIINPYSNLTDNEKQAVIKNEKIRLNFKENNIVPDIDITEEQRALFKGTPYENNEDAMKQTIVARIMTGDPSANATKEQTMVANKTLTQTLLKEKGYTPTAIAGIMANIDVETGGTFNFQEKQRGGKGYGVFQFDFLNPYYQKYLEKSEKKDSLESQIDFMHETVYGNEQDIIGRDNAKKLREGLENAKTPEEAAEIFMNIFEKPGVPHLDRRIKAASKYVSD